MTYRTDGTAALALDVAWIFGDGTEESELEEALRAVRFRPHWLVREQPEAVAIVEAMREQYGEPAEWAEGVLAGLDGMGCMELTNHHEYGRVLGRSVRARIW